MQGVDGFGTKQYEKAGVENVGVEKSAHVTGSGKCWSGNSGTTLHLIV